MVQPSERRAQQRAEQQRREEEQRLENARVQLQNDAVIEKNRAEEQSKEEGEDPLGKLHGGFHKFRSYASPDQGHGLNSLVQSEVNERGTYGEQQAQRGEYDQRYSGFLNEYSRNFRRVAGDDDAENPDPQAWWLASGTFSPYIDAMADKELVDNDGEPGFWNMYSGLHNLVGKILGSAYGVEGA